MSAQQNQLKDISKADFSDFMNSYNYIPVRKPPILKLALWILILGQISKAFPISFDAIGLNTNSFWFEYITVYYYK